MAEPRTFFDPSKYLTKVGTADYLEVKWRLVWLRDNAPDAQIDTQLVDRGQDWAIFKATVSIPNGGSATGYGSESKNDFREFLEKAETKAIGRALAALGFGTQFSFDHDFQEGAHGTKIVDSPVDRQNGPGAQLPPRHGAQGQNVAPNGNGAAPQQGNGITEPQIRKIVAMSKQSLSMTDEQMHEFAGVASLYELDKRGASSVIERLTALEADPDPGF